VTQWSECTLALSRKLHSNARKGQKRSSQVIGDSLMLIG
jgi:hypothetical protein